MLPVSSMSARSVLSLNEVAWDEYHQLHRDLGEGYPVRVFYSNGRMGIMAARCAGDPKSVIHTLITVLRDELDVDIECLGSTTLRAEMKRARSRTTASIYETLRWS